MSREIFHSRSVPRVRVPRVQARVAHRFLRYLRGPASPAPAVLDMSVVGVKLVGPGAAPERGTRLAVALSHPVLGGAPITVDALVRWVRPHTSARGRTYLAGLEFVGTTPEQRAQLESMLSLELGSMISISPHGHAGYATLARDESDSELTVYVYDLERAEVGSVKDEGDALMAARSWKRGAVEYRTGDQLASLILWIFGLEGGKVTIEPPIDFAPGAAARPSAG